jgi:vacuolar-type H+-ATPase subunit H
VSDVIEHVLEAERQARRILEEAEQESGEIIERARQEARRLVTSSREHARHQAEELRKTNARALQQQNEKRIAAERNKLASVDQMDEEALNAAADFAVNVVAFGEEAEG